MRWLRRGGFLGRRRLRPRWFRGGSIRPLATPVIRRLRRAHNMVAAGEFGEGAAELEAIAQQAAAKGIPMAALLMVEAGLAWIQGGEVSRGVALAERGLAWVSEGEAGTRLAMLRDRVGDTLRKAGYSAEAEAILKSFEVAEATPQQPAVRKDLPGECPQCGGIVRTDEVEWIDDSSAVCDYCGSILKASPA
jgi:hypothetical protein